MAAIAIFIVDIKEGQNPNRFAAFRSDFVNISIIWLIGRLYLRGPLIRDGVQQTSRTQIESLERNNKNLLQFVPNGLPGDLQSRGTYAKLKKLANNQNNSQDTPRKEIYSATGTKVVASLGRGGGAHRMQPRNHPPSPPR
jgi:hypothetical protein